MDQSGGESWNHYSINAAQWDWIAWLCSLNWFVGRCTSGIHQQRELQYQECQVCQCHHSRNIPTQMCLLMNTSGTPLLGIQTATWLPTEVNRLLLRSLWWKNMKVNYYLLPSLHRSLHLSLFYLFVFSYFCLCLCMCVCRSSCLYFSQKNLDLLCLRGMKNMSRATHGAQKCLHARQRIVYPLLSIQCLLKALRCLSGLYPLVVFCKSIFWRPYA